MTIDNMDLFGVNVDMSSGLEDISSMEVSHSDAAVDVAYKTTSPQMDIKVFCCTAGDLVPIGKYIDIKKDAISGAFDNEAYFVYDSTNCDLMTRRPGEGNGNIFYLAGEVINDPSHNIRYLYVTTDSDDSDLFQEALGNIYARPTWYGDKSGTNPVNGKLNAGVSLFTSNAEHRGETFKHISGFWLRDCAAISANPLPGNKPPNFPSHPMPPGDLNNPAPDPYNVPPLKDPVSVPNPHPSPGYGTDIPIVHPKPYTQATPTLKPQTTTHSRLVTI